MNDQPENPSPPLVVRTEHLDPVAEAWIAERCEFLAAAPDDGAFESVATRIAGLVVRTYTDVNEALLDRLPSLKVVARAGVGVDNIDVAACRRRGIEVVHTPDANTQAVVEYVTALLCDALRPRVFVQEAIDQTAWNEIRSEICAQSQMNELSLGILGFGRIGRRIAEVAGAIGFTVRYHDLLDIDASLRAGAEPVSLESLLEQSDVLTIHVDGRESNRGLIDAALLGVMKSDSILLNTSRGFVVNESAVADWLTRNPAAQAVLDVHANEPFTADDPLIPLPNAHLAPHLASRTTTAMANMSMVVEDLWRVLEGEQPNHPAPAPE
jgi:phosphoglycerate dehydrogenase-like enzyme